MKCSKRNATLFLPVLALAAGLASAQSSPPARIPASYPTANNPLVTNATPRIEFEGPNTADFFNSINNPSSPNSSLMANPQIAVGPDEIVTVVNSQIWRLPNGNSAGNLPTGLYPGSALIGGQGFGAQRASLDNWIGAKALAELCPTGNTDPSGGVIDSGNTRSSVTCQLDNATVTYDQMQGRFLVLFTVVDTGLTFNQATQSYALTRPRKASWVLLVSRFAVLVDQACFQGTEVVGAGGCPAPPIPGSQPNAAGSFAFVTPTPPVGSNTGGINTAIWAIYYGNSLNALGNDGFGSNKAHAGAWVGTVGVGNINSLPGIAGSAASFDCSPGAVSASGTLPTTVCYYPTGARLGVDNDTVTIVSPVVDGNINGADLGVLYNPTAVAGTNQVPGYAGNRIRVIKKTGLYTFSGLTAGNQFAATAAAAAGTGVEYYDLYTSASAPAAGGTPVTNVPAIPFTAILNDMPCTIGTRPDFGSDGTSNAGVLCRMSPIFYEPAHLRGRAQASFSNLAIPQIGALAGAVSPLQTSQTYLMAAISSPILQNSLYVQGVQEVVVGPPGANTFGPIPFFPVLTGIQVGALPPAPTIINCTAAIGTGVPSTLAQQGVPCRLGLPGFFTNPNPVQQQNFRGSGDTPGDGPAAPFLFVGDDRPHNVIFREGYLYDARVIATTSDPQGLFPVGGSLSTTTKYEIVQKLCATNTGAGVGACPTALPNVTLTGNITTGSTTITNLSGAGTTVLAPGMLVCVVTPCVGIPAGTTIVSLSPDGTTKTIIISLPATATTTGLSMGFGFSPTLANPNLTYQQIWQNTNAYAPMFDVPANVVTFGVGTPYNALSFLEKLFVATTVPPLAGLPDPAYNSVPVLAASTLPAIVTAAQAAQLTALTNESDFVGGDPRTRETFGSTGFQPIQLPARGNCYSSQLSPGGPISGVPNNPLAYASLFDTRCGTDVTDSNPQFRDPYTGRQTAGNYPSTGQTPSTAAYTIRGGEAIDMNDGSLWNFGAYGARRDASFTSLAHWGTFAANYKLSFPITDVYGNSTTLFNDIAGLPEQNFIQIAVNNGLTPAIANGAGIPLAPPNSFPIPFVGNQVYTGAGAPGTAPAPGNFGPNDAITRREMAYWIVKSIMDESAITLYLTNSVALNGVSGYSANAVTFADVPFNDPGWRYVEVMARKGWTSGCAAGVARRYCPDYISTRRDLAAFMIRAKFGNVFGSTLSGCAFGFLNGTTSSTSTIFPPSLTTNCSSANSGDNFGLFISGLPYFTDNPAVTGNDWFVFVQKMRELRITNGTSLGPNSDGRNGTYNIGASGVPPIGDPGNLLRKQVVTFMVRGFFL